MLRKPVTLFPPYPKPHPTPALCWETYDSKDDAWDIVRHEYRKRGAVFKVLSASSIIIYTPKEPDVLVYFLDRSVQFFVKKSNEVQTRIGRLKPFKIPVPICWAHLATKKIKHHHATRKTQ